MQNRRYEGRRKLLARGSVNMPVVGSSARRGRLYSIRFPPVEEFAPAR
jgi:hypothetical protein